jgi:type VI secretion system protein ImpF
LQPALLDRLTDKKPDEKTEAPDAVFMTRSRLREAVLRDLKWLLNTTNMEAEIGFDAFPQARRSVINFGVESLSGRRVFDVDWGGLEQGLKESILAFEPRLLPNSLEVRVVTAENAIDHHNVLSFEIRCQLWSVPYPLELLLRSNLDLESGQVSVLDQAAGST